MCIQFNVYYQYLFELRKPLPSSLKDFIFTYDLNNLLVPLGRQSLKLAINNTPFVLKYKYF